MICLNEQRILPSPNAGVDEVWFSGISNPQQHNWSLGRSCPIRSRTAESVSISTLGVTRDTVGGSTLVVTGGVVGGSTLVVTGGLVDGGSVTTVVLFTLGVVGGTWTGGFVPTMRNH